jgi:L-threonylcarbamoyladenylate synthase
VVFDGSLDSHSHARPWSYMDIDHAINVLKQDGIVVFATETAYALGCDATSDRAVERLMEAKGREEGKTPPLIVADFDMVERYADLSDQLVSLARKYWPGPLTIVAPVRVGSGLSSRVVRDGTVAIRVSSRKTARELSRAINAPLVATSANVAGQSACYRVEDACAQFADRALLPDAYLDEGPLAVRRASTIVRELDGQIKVLRQGDINLNSSHVA